MATYQYSLFPYHLAISLNPAVDSIEFGAGVSAADFFVGDYEEDHSALLVNGDRLLFIDIGTQPSSFWSGMFQFQDGSMVLVGDNSPGRFDDDLAQTITGGAGFDLIDSSDVGFGAGINANLAGGTIVYSLEEYFGGTLTHTIAVSNVAAFVGASNNDTITGGNENNAFDG